MSCKAKMIRLAEKIANDRGVKIYVMKFCSGYDFLEQKEYESQDKRAVYIAVPNN